MEERRDIGKGLNQPSVFSMITDSDSLNEHCANWAESPFVAMDTEFIRTSTFYPKVGLIQVCDGRKNYLIDPLVIDDWSRFTELMFSPTVLKIFHSCSEDLLVFFAFIGVVPAPVFDTQIANAFLNDGFALSYQNMVKAVLDIDIPKDETRSDWLQRPLTEQQLKYATLDVAYLPQIYAKQCQLLKAQNRLSWMQEDCQRLILQYTNELKQDFSEYYLNLKAAWQLDGENLAALKELSTWRELRARKRDKPRTWIIKDKPLFAIAKSLPQNSSALAQIPDVSPNFIRYEGQGVLDIVQSIKKISVSEFPSTLPRPLSNSQKSKFKKAQKFAEEKAQELSLPIEILARKRCLMALYNDIIQRQSKDSHVEIDKSSIIAPEELLGWRKVLLLDGLLEILQ